MKRFLVSITTAIIGSALTVGMLAYSSIGDDLIEKKIKINHVDVSMGKPVVFTKNADEQLVPLDFKDVAKNTMESVVHIKSSQTVNTRDRYYGHQQLTDPFEQFFGGDMFKEFFGPRHRFKQNGTPNRDSQVKAATGSGVIINADGYIVTNYHVINQADEIEVTLHDNRSYKASVVGTDPSTDLALIQIRESNLPTVSLVNSDDVEVGEWVLAVGNPFNLTSTVTAGIVSAKARNINILKEKGAIESFIQTDAAINPGNSGGALVSLDGGLVGINTAIASPTGSYSGYGFAIPANIVNKVIEDLLKFGVVQRGYLGAMIRSLDGKLSEELELEIAEGVYVDSLLESSAAKDAGIKVGDVILKVDDITVASAPQLQELIGRQRPGDRVDLTILRNGNQKKMEVILHNHEGNVALIDKERMELLDVLGASFEDVDKATAKKLNISGGALLRKLEAGKLRKQTDIREGYIITKVDNDAVNSVRDLISKLEKKKGGVMVEGIYKDYPGSFYYAFGL